MYPGSSSNSRPGNPQHRPPQHQQQPLPGSEVPLPPGWLHQFDFNSNRPYWVNTATGVSQWTPPQMQHQPPPPQMQQQIPFQHQQQQHQQPQQQQHHHHQHQPQQMGRPGGGPTGKRKALFIGINYTGHKKGQLSGCINDVRNIKSFLINQYKFPSDPNSMVVLTDDQRDPNFIPTRRNIINAMDWLVGGAQPGDTFFFHFSGHGSQQKDKDGDEADGYDETICPVDYQRAGMITDDEMHARMVAKLPKGCKFIGLFDSCHSGTALDLPYLYNLDGTIKQKTFASALGGGIQDSLMGGGKRGGMGLLGMGMALASGIQTAMNTEKAEEITKKTRTTACHAISLSGCKDKQTSADAHIKGVGATGAMSYALITTLKSNPYPKYGDLLNGVRGILKNKYSQIPQLSSGHPISMNETFYI